MNHKQDMRRVLRGILMAFLFFHSGLNASPALPLEQPGQIRFISEQTEKEVVTALTKLHGENLQTRIKSSVNRIATIWWAEDGSEEEFAAFCKRHFIGDAKRRAEALRKTDSNLETLKGHLHQINRALRSPFLLNLGDPKPEDSLFVDAIPSTDFFDSKVAFFIALNFPAYSLDQMLAQGPKWSRQEWAAARLGEMFGTRLPADAEAKISRIGGETGNYFQNYLIRMDRVLTPDHKLLFPEGLALSCHHGLRDNLKGQYTKTDGLERQEYLFSVMMRIIDQTIPKRVINNPDLFWEPGSNAVFTQENGKYLPAKSKPEGNSRYQVLLNAFRVNKVKDPFYPAAPTYIQRTFTQRQMPEERVETLIISILKSPEAASVAELVSKRLGRPLRPFDIWYNGFQAQGERSEDDLDVLVRKKYPNPTAFQADIPTILRRLGFPEDKIRFLSAHTVVDPVRIGGHADGAAMKGDKSHLRTVFNPEGLDYKGFRIGMHEVGHTVHQNMARYGSDYYVLGGMPMSGFSEAIAEVFAYQNMKALGLEDQPDPNERDLQALACFWYLFEHGGQALTEMRTWRWLYAHPDADADQLKEAVQDIAKGIWNEFYAPLFGEEDVPLLSIYAHFISGSLYLNSYVLGNIIMYQLYDYMAGKDLPEELERMCKQGRLTPDLWMERAVGSPVSITPLLRDVHHAVKKVQ